LVLRTAGAGFPPGSGKPAGTNAADPPGAAVLGTVIRGEAPANGRQIRLCNIQRPHDRGTIGRTGSVCIKQAHWMNIETAHTILQQKHFEINQTRISNAVAAISLQSCSSTGMKLALSTAKPVQSPFRAEYMTRKRDKGEASPST
jgi:hypothetical protein